MIAPKPVSASLASSRLTNASAHMRRRMVALQAATGRRSSSTSDVGWASRSFATTSPVTTTSKSAVGAAGLRRHERVLCSSSSSSSTTLPESLLIATATAASKRTATTNATATTTTITTTTTSAASSSHSSTTAASSCVGTNVASAPASLVSSSFARSNARRSFAPSLLASSAPPSSKTCATRLLARRFAAAATTDQIRYSIRSSQTIIETSETSKVMPPLEELVFGRTFTDHMLTIKWDSFNGWGIPHIEPYGPISIEPSAQVFHYGMECFEGMKAYRDPKGNVRLFRPMENMSRFNLSSQRLCLPAFNSAELLRTIEQLVLVDEKWIPGGFPYSLYIRPTAIATEKALGVGPPNSAMIFVIMCPVGPYFPDGFAAVRLKAESDCIRAFVGGTGQYKVGGNYAPTIHSQLRAAREGFSQVLWLTGPSDDALVTEVGTMNLFVFWETPDGKKQLVTPSLDSGLILPGITRKSIIELTQSWGEFEVVEREFTIIELTTALKENRVKEMFGAGTAAVVAPIKGLSRNDVEYTVPLDPANPDIQAGPLTQRVARELQAIQWGEVDHPWSTLVDPNVITPQNYI